MIIFKIASVSLLSSALCFASVEIKDNSNISADSQQNTFQLSPILPPTVNRLYESDACSPAISSDSLDLVFKPFVESDFHGIIPEGPSMSEFSMMFFSGKSVCSPAPNRKRKINFEIPPLDFPDFLFDENNFCSANQNLDGRRFSPGLSPIKEGSLFQEEDRSSESSSVKALLGTSDAESESSTHNVCYWKEESPN